MVINSVLCMLYYNVIISWAIFYFVSSFRKTLLWKNCGHSWNDANCFETGSGNKPYVLNDTMYNCTELQFNMSLSSCVPIDPTKRATSTEQFYL